MIRGALILAVGFSLGYGMALRDSDEITVLLRELIDELKHFPADAVPVPDEESEEVVDVEVPDEDETDEAPDDKEQQGETA